MVAVIACLALGVFGMACVKSGTTAETLSAAQQTAPTRSEKLVERVLNSKSTYDAAKLQRELFKPMGAEELRALKRDPRTGIALAAAWEEVRRSANKPREPLRPNRKVLQRFLGFVEGRLLMVIPGWWEKTVMKCVAHQECVYFKELDDEQYHKAGLGLYGWRDTSLEEQDGHVVIQVGSKRLSIGSADFARFLREARLGEGDWISAWIGGTQSYIALYDSFYSHYTLLCVGNESGKMLWHAEVRAIVPAPGGGTGSGPWHHVSLVVDDSRVLAVGAGNDGVYIEGFNTTNGKNLFRFSAYNYWDN